MARRLKLYLDTSVISHLDQQDAPDKMADTWKLWKEIETGMYEIFVSETTITELLACPEPKRTRLIYLLSEITHTRLQETEEVVNLAQAYLDAGILRSRSLSDSFHLAYSSVYGCDIILSWNFKDIVNHKTATGVKGVNAINGYREVLIYPPTMLVQEGEQNGETRN